MANIQKVKFEMTINFEIMPYESEAQRIERVKKMFSKNPFVVFGQSYQIEAEILPSISFNQISLSLQNGENTQ
jgi:hypothetical protein